MSKISEYLQARKEIKSKVNSFLEYIRKGFYYLTAKQNNLVFVKITVKNIFNIFNLKRVYFVRGGGSIISFAIISGYEKNVLLIGQYCISKYFYSNVPIKMIELRIKKYESFLRVPHCKYLSFDSNKDEIITEFIKGEKKRDAFHSRIIIKRLFEEAQKSKVFMLGVNKEYCFYVQHGDVYIENCIWQGDSFIVIDCESMGLFPAFYDVFEMIGTMVKTPNDFLEVCKEYSNYFCSFFNTGIDNFNNFIDLYLSLFVFFRLHNYIDNSIQNNHLSLFFLNCNDANTLFPKAYNVFTKIKNGVEEKEYKSLLFEAHEFDVE